MNPPASPRRLAPLALAGLLLAPGCGRPPQTDTTAGTDQKGTAEAKADPWEGVVRRLRKETDPGACKTALGQLNTDLVSRPDVTGPAPLGSDAEKKLAALVPLAQEDAAEIRPAGYSGLDPVYLADAFYLRDTARSLDPGSLPPADLARVGFEWVCREVYIHPWVIQGRGFVPAVPPTYVLRRGHGSGLERAYVFLALLQQAGLDGCLIGPPDAAAKEAGVSPKGPFWAVGVRVGADILLFEPWRGQPFPGPDGKGIGTLAQVKANPDQLKPWFEDKTAKWDVTADDIKKAAVFLAVPVSSLSPRMAMLDAKLQPETGVRLAVDPAALRDRFTAAAPGGPGLPAGEVRFWNPLGDPSDRFAYGRVLSQFLPAEEGGLDRGDPRERLHTRYQFDLLPRSVLVIPPEVPPAAADRLRNAAAGAYLAAFFTPPTPRERIQRGQFQDAARDVTDKLETFGRGLDRLRKAAPGQVAEWIKEVNEAYTELRAAQYPDPLQREPLSDADPGVAAARGRVEGFWKQQGQTAQLIIDQASARVGRAEATYLLALVKHEEAERQQLRADRAAGADAGRAKATAAMAWREAANAWASYLELAGSQAGFPGRADHAKALAARARQLAPKE